jgi:hypothetical protein
MQVLGVIRAGIIKDAGMEDGVVPCLLIKFKQHPATLSCLVGATHSSHLDREGYNRRKIPIPQTHTNVIIIGAFVFCADLKWKTDKRPSRALSGR